MRERDRLRRSPAKMRVLYREVLRVLPVLRTAGEPKRLVSNFINGLKSLPVRIG
ncbi:hypothetical protein AB5J55_33000 [Streptomyces sp. R11]|uniref:Transposase n=1 Tax=Streptomyces sp. R11 TaxID=3238625 RepID=A0AB39N8J9_9ACTN